jgi:ABC-2 type transport system permease protein
MELERIGIRSIGGGWVVQLPLWLQILVYANPISYQLDLLRLVLLRFQQLPMLADLLVAIFVPIIAAVIAAMAMARMYKQ